MGAGVCLAPKLLTWGSGPSLNASSKSGGSWPLEGLGSGAPRPRTSQSVSVYPFTRYCFHAGHQPPLLRLL